MNGYFVSITNNLLEDKHYEKMGNAVWLYMWLIDKMTDISEGVGIVNGGHPVTYELVNENFKKLSERTYHRMVATLRNEDYINTAQAQHGLYITINKPKKQFGKKAISSPAKNGKAKTSAKPKMARLKNPALPNLSSSPAKNGVALYIDNNTNTINNINTTDVVLGDAEKIGVLYYQVIKKLKLPVRNHNNVKSTIKKIQAENHHEGNIKYLEFMLNSFEDAVYDYKPSVNEALDIYTKRNQIINTAKRSTVKPTGRGWKAKNR